MQRAYLTFLVLAVLLSACAGSVIPLTAEPIQITPQNTNPTETVPPGAMPAITPPKTKGKLSARLALLAGSTDLQTASAEEQASALSLPAKGAGSLARDDQGRILVTLRVTDVADANLQALREAGAVIGNVSQTYLTITAYLAVQDLQAAANLPFVQSIQEELTPGG